MTLSRERTAVAMRIYIGESDRHEGRPLFQHLLETFRKEGVAGATVLRGIAGYGETSRIHTTHILRLSTDLPVIIEVVDKKETIDRIRPLVMESVRGGLVTEEEVKISLCRGKKE